MWGEKVLLALFLLVAGLVAQSGLGSQAGWVGWLGRLAPPHGHQQTKDEQAKANAVVPGLQVPHERNRRASQVVDHEVQQPSQDEEKHQALVPLRGAAGVDLDRGAAGAGGLAGELVARL